MALPDGYVRKGRPLNFQIDHDAVQLLYEIVSSRKGHGKYISELIRRDAIRRQEWAQVRAGLPAFVEVPGE
jgi:hypothetical protein